MFAPGGSDCTADAAVARKHEAHDKSLVFEEVNEDIDGGADCCQETGEVAHTF